MKGLSCRVATTITLMLGCTTYLGLLGTLSKGYRDFFFFPGTISQSSISVVPIR